MNNTTRTQILPRDGQMNTLEEVLRLIRDLQPDIISERIVALHRQERAVITERRILEHVLRAVTGYRKIIEEDQAIEAWRKENV
jgi:hypothetical protein